MEFIPYPTEKPRTRRVKNVLTAEEFSNEVKGIRDNYSSINTIAKVVYGLSRGEKIRIPPSNAFPSFPEGVVIGPTEVRSLQSQLSSSIAELSTNYKDAIPRRRVKKEGTEEEKKKFGMYRVMVGPELMEFIRKADFGSSYSMGDDGYQSNNRPLLEDLNLLREEGLAYASTIAELFYTYSYVHNLIEGNLYHADKLMMETLGPIFTRITNDRIANPKISKITGRPVIFDPKSFNLTGFYSIIRFGRYIRPKDTSIPPGAKEMSEQQLEVYNDESLDEELQKEYLVAHITKKARAQIHLLQNPKPPRQSRPKKKATTTNA